MQWWNNATIRAFRERTQCIIDQYSRYKIDEVGLYVNGRMTQGENIADNGGLKQSFRVRKRFFFMFKAFDKKLSYLETHICFLKKFLKVLVFVCNILSVDFKFNSNCFLKISK